MNNAKKSPQKVACPCPPTVERPDASRAGAVWQPKAAPPPPHRKTPTPPPVYSPQSAPRVAQQKSQLPQPRQPQPAQPRAASGAKQTPTATPAHRPAAPPVYHPAVQPKVLQAKPVVPARAHGGVIQRAAAPVGGDDDGGWSTVSYKPKLSADERAERREERRKQIDRLAQAEIQRHRPRGDQSTFCVFLDVNGRLLATGESGWSKEGKGKAITRLLDNHAVKDIGQEMGYGGIVCAEPDAVLNADAAGVLGNVIYSLAYDLKSNSYKAACGSCKHLLKKYGITDLY